MYTDVLRIYEIVKLSPTAIALRLDLKGNEFNFIPGQYIQIELVAHGKNYKRSYSLSSPPHEKRYLEFTLNAMPGGFFSNYLVHNLQEEDKIKIRGPFGRFMLDAINSKSGVLFLAAGSGISPFMSMLRSINDENSDINVTLLYSNKTEDEILWRKEIEEISRKNKNIKHVFTLTQQSWDGEMGRINRELIFRFTPDKKNTDFYICGSREFVRDIEKILHEIEIPEGQIKFEIF